MLICSSKSSSIIIQGPTELWVKRETPTILHIKVCLQVLGGSILELRKKKLFRAFCVSRGSWVKSDEWPQVMSKT